MNSSQTDLDRKSHVLEIAPQLLRLCELEGDRELVVAQRLHLLGRERTPRLLRKDFHLESAEMLIVNETN